MVKKDIPVKNANILVLGITFKENCPDVRNTKVIDVLNALKDYDANITVYDPWAEPAEVKHEYGWDSIRELNDFRDYDAIVLAVAHDQFKKLDLMALCKENKVIYDVKGILGDIADGKL
ncbi:UDP binding domain-containing protein [Pedobacter panaciterrae]